VLLPLFNTCFCLLQGRQAARFAKESGKRVSLQRQGARSKQVCHGLRQPPSAVPPEPPLPHVSKQAEANDGGKDDDADAMDAPTTAARGWGSAIMSLGGERVSPSRPQLE
jgi:hypothetical protein